MTIRSQNIMEKLNPGEKWFIAIFVEKDDSRLLILKAKAEQQNTRWLFGEWFIPSPGFCMSCKTEAVYVQHYSKITVLLFSIKDDPSKQPFVFIWKWNDVVDAPGWCSCSWLGDSSYHAKPSRLYVSSVSNQAKKGECTYSSHNLLIAESAWSSRLLFPNLRLWWLLPATIKTSNSFSSTEREFRASFWQRECF